MRRNRLVYWTHFDRKAYLEVSRLHDFIEAMASGIPTTELTKEELEHCNDLMPRRLHKSHGNGAKREHAMTSRMFKNAYIKPLERSQMQSPWKKAR